MARIVHVQELQRLGGYRLKLWFDDGMAGEWDFVGVTTLTGSMVEPLRQEACFNRVFIEAGALTWPNGYDWSPGALYAEMANAGALSEAAAVA